VRDWISYETRNQVNAPADFEACSLSLPDEACDDVLEILQQPQG
jgi:hypothetical protein